MIMIDNKNSEIILCSGIKLDKNYENVLSYNEEEMVNLCRNNSIYTAKEYSFIGNTNYIDIECPYQTTMYSNYVAFLNPTFGNKWMFCWVTDVKLINPKTSRIFFEIDVFSTWYSRFNVGEAFIEREHVDDDEVGLHTLPENLETGDYIIDNKIKKNGYGKDNMCFILATTVFPWITQEDGNWVLSGGRSATCNIYNSNLSGLEYFWYTNTENGITKLQHTIEAFANSGKADAIYMLFACPDSCFEKVLEDPEDGSWGSVKQKQGSYNKMWTDDNTDTIYKATSLNGYTPRNNKLLTYPYCYLLMNNGNGGNAIYQYELFKNSENFCYFTIDHAICPSASIYLRPYKYKNSDNTYNQMDGLPLGKFPMCSWNSDAYINWLTQNSANIKMGMVESAFNVGANVASQNVTGALSSGLGLISNIMQLQNKRDTMTPQASGNINSGDVIYSIEETTYTCYQMSIKEEYAIIIDRYFSRFGYKVNIVKTPNLNSRAKFNFIKVGGMDELISGNIPASDLEKINSLFRKGITIFHDYNAFGDYTISNPIVNHNKKDV